MEAFAEALDDGGIVGDATVNKSGALAASVTRAAVDTLEDALAEVEALVARAPRRRNSRRDGTTRKTSPSRRTTPPTSPTARVTGRPARTPMKPPPS